MQQEGGLQQLPTCLIYLSKFQDAAFTLDRWAGAGLQTNREHWQSSNSVLGLFPHLVHKSRPFFAVFHIYHARSKEAQADKKMETIY